MQVPELISEKADIETDDKISHDSNACFACERSFPCFVGSDTGIAGFYLSYTGFDSFFHKKKIKKQPLSCRGELLYFQQIF